MAVIFGGGSSNAIQATGKESQTIEGSLVLTADNAVNMSFENSDGLGSVGITQDGDLLLNCQNGNVIVGTPDGSDENAVVNVQYVNNVVGTIENVLETI